MSLRSVLGRTPCDDARTTHEKRWAGPLLPVPLGFTVQTSAIAFNSAP